MSDIHQSNDELSFHLDLELTEDIATELEHFVLVSRLNIVEEARRMIDTLQPHVQFFPVFAEIADYYLWSNQIPALKALVTSARCFVETWLSEDRTFFKAITCYLGNTLEDQVLDVIGRRRESAHLNDSFEFLGSALLNTDYDSPTSIHTMEICLFSINRTGGVRQLIVDYFSNMIVELNARALLWESARIFAIFCRFYSRTGTPIDDVVRLYSVQLSHFERGRLFRELNSSSTIRPQDVPRAFCIKAVCTALLLYEVVRLEHLIAAFASDVELLSRCLLAAFGFPLSKGQRSLRPHPDNYTSWSSAVGDITTLILDHRADMGHSPIPFWISRQEEAKLKAIWTRTRHDALLQRQQTLSFLAQTGFFSGWNEVCDTADACCQTAAQLGTSDTVLLGLAPLSTPVLVSSLPDHVVSDSHTPPLLPTTPPDSSLIKAALILIPVISTLSVFFSIIARSEGNIKIVEVMVMPLSTLCGFWAVYSSMTLSSRTRKSNCPMRLAFSSTKTTTGRYQRKDHGDIRKSSVGKTLPTQGRRRSSRVRYD